MSSEYNCNLASEVGVERVSRFPLKFKGFLPLWTDVPLNFILKNQLEDEENKILIKQPKT